MNTVSAVSGPEVHAITAIVFGVKRNGMDTASGKHDDKDGSFSFELVALTLLKLTDTSYSCHQGA